MAEDVNKNSSVTREIKPTTLLNVKALWLEWELCV